MALVFLIGFSVLIGGVLALAVFRHDEGGWRELTIAVLMLALPMAFFMPAFFSEHPLVGPVFLAWAAMLSVLNWMWSLGASRAMTRRVLIFALLQAVPALLILRAV